MTKNTDKKDGIDTAKDSLNTVNEVTPVVIATPQRTFTAILKTGISKKTKNEYKYFEIEIHPLYKKKAFLEEAQSVLIGVLNKAEFTATQGEGIAKESGKPYHCLDVHITEDCIGKYFLDHAELALIQLEAMGSTLPQAIPK